VDERVGLHGGQAAAWRQFAIPTPSPDTGRDAWGYLLHRRTRPSACQGFRACGSARFCRPS